MKNKKLIRIECSDNLPQDTYKTTFSESMYFALVSAGEETKNGYKVKKQISRFTPCRESFNDGVGQFIHKTGDIYICDSINDAMDRKYLRLLIAVKRNSPTKERMFAAKHIINILEAESGWPKSVITTVKHNDYKNNNYRFYLITGPEQWIRVPQMLSMVTLILRIVATSTYDMKVLKVKNMKEVNALFKMLAKVQPNRGPDNDYIGECRKHIIPLMKNIDHIFKGNTDRFYLRQFDNGWAGYGGISSFLKCATKSDEFTKIATDYLKTVKRETQTV